VVNFRQVLNLLGLLIVGLGAMLAAAAACSAVMMLRGREAERGAFLGLLVAAGASLALGGVLWRATRARFDMLGRREAFVVVAAAWLCARSWEACPISSGRGWRRTAPTPS